VLLTFFCQRNKIVQCLCLSRKTKLDAPDGDYCIFTAKGFLRIVYLWFLRFSILIMK
jgi:hypothetical protein